MALIGFRVLALAVGYAFGLFQTGYFYGKSKGIDIHDKGSGNVGTTNTLRVLGKKAGLITFLGDLLKAVLAVLLVRIIFQNTEAQAAGIVKILELYAGLGVVLGHNYPFYLKFRGGKGIACTAGVVVAVLPQAAPVSLLIFILVVAVTRYVSLGSILAVTAYLVHVVVFVQMGWFIHLDKAGTVEFTILSACFTAMALWRHRANIVRLAKGTENKLGAKKEGGKNE